MSCDEPQLRYAVALKIDCASLKPSRIQGAESGIERLHPRLMSVLSKLIASSLIAGLIGESVWRILLLCSVRDA